MLDASWRAAAYCWHPLALLWGLLPLALAAGGALGLGWVEEGEAVCPLHRWRFKLTTGRCTTVRGESVHAFRCEVRGDEVWVEA